MYCGPYDIVSGPDLPGELGDPPPWDEVMDRAYSVRFVRYCFGGHRGIAHARHPGEPQTLCGVSLLAVRDGTTDRAPRPKELRGARKLDCPTCIRETASLLDEAQARMNKGTPQTGSLAATV